MQAARGEGGDPATVLVVEDNDAVRQLIRLALEGTGPRVLTARSAAEAATVAAGVQIDLLIADVILPDLGGPELATKLRAEHPGLRVIYVSGWYDHVTFPELRDGVLLRKPFTLQELRQAVATAIGDRPA